jgi:hypothetical protein
VVARPATTGDLAPIEAADGRTAGVLIETLAGYLDHADSRTRAAAAPLLAVLQHPQPARQMQHQPVARSACG